MTKKRFIKLLMCKGEQIRQARTIALRYNTRGVPYKEAYTDYLLKTSIPRVLSKFGQAAKVLGDNIAKITQSLKKFTEVIKNETTF